MTAVHLDRSFTLGRIELFASSPDDPRARRPIDWIRCVVALMALGLFGVLAELGGNLDSEVGSVAVDFPPVLHVFWLVLFWLALAWSLTLLGFAIFSRRTLLAVEIVGSAALGMVLAGIVGAFVTGNAERVFTAIIDTDGPPTFPPAALAITSAVMSTMAPYITLPFRRFGRFLMVGQVVAVVFLGVSLGMGALAAYAAGALAGSVVHLIVGSPGGNPTVGRVNAALLQLGVQIDDLARIRMRRDGVALLQGHDREGPVFVKVYGRDAWDGELLATMWLHLWYRDTRRSLRLKRSEYVEHEGFMTFLAARSGLRVPEVVTAGKAENGDALIVARPSGKFLEVDDITLTETEITSLWDQLAALHQAGIRHGRVDLDRIVRHDDGTAGFGDLSSSSVQAIDVDYLQDRAQLFGLSVLTTGEETAVACARTALGDPDLADVLPYVQEAALPPIVRYALDKRDVDLDDVRKRLTDTIGAEKAELVRLRRVTTGSIVNMVLLSVAAFTIITMLGGIDFDEFWNALQSANWWWLLIALFVGQTPRVSAAFSTMGSTTHQLPLGPTTALQFATCYINLTVPSSAGRVALTTRFFQRHGIPVATALAAGFIDTLSQTAIQISLFLLIYFGSDVDFGISLDPDELSGLATIALIALGVLIVAVLAVIFVPSVRRRIVEPIRHMRDAFQVFRLPGKVLHLIGGNLGSEILFAITLAIVTRAFGYELPLTEFILINTTISLFSSVIPVPGGIGVTEAGLTWGLTAAGIPNDTAFAIALTHRMITFYLPPFWGFMCYQWLIKHRFL